jgi:hypothetical protein
MNVDIQRILWMSRPCWNTLPYVLSRFSFRDDTENTNNCGPATFLFVFRPSLTNLNLDGKENRNNTTGRPAVLELTIRITPGNLQTRANGKPVLTRYQQHEKLLVKGSITFFS